LSLRVQTSDSEKAGKFFWYEIKDRVTRVQILSSRNESSGFMQNDRKRSDGMNQFAIDFDVIARSWLRTEVCANPTVNGHAPCSDQLVAMAA
jgi:hypothetical protein